MSPERVHILELTVEMTCGACVNQISSVLKTLPGIRKFDIDLKKQTVLVEGSAAPSNVYNSLKGTGRTVIVRGQGSPYSATSGAAVCIFEEQGENTESRVPGKTKGLARLVQTDPALCFVDLTVEGLAPGLFAVSVHELGDFSDGCKSTGPCFDLPTTAKSSPSPYPSPSLSTLPFDRNHGHSGDLGTVLVDSAGRGTLVTETDRFRVCDVIGRSMVLSRLEEYNYPNQPSKFVQTAGVLGGIIARSAGLFENTKVVCACTGKTLWQEAKEMNANL